MKHLANLSFALVLLLAAASAAALPAAPQQREFFSDAEVDRLRDAQGLEFRIPMLFALADKRLVTLGIKQLTEKEKDAHKKADAKLDDLVFKNSGRMPVRPKNGADPDAYLKAFSKTDLLRGFTETVNSLTDFIEDAYTRKQDVRPALEALVKYLKPTRPLLDAFKPANDAEKLALEEAQKTTDEAIHDAAEALDTIPLTEKKPPKP